jgi:hypothetical protein
VLQKLDLSIVKRVEKYPNYLYHALENIERVRQLSLLSPYHWDKQQLGFTILTQASQNITILELSRMDVSLMRFDFPKLEKLVLDSVVFDDSICYEYPNLRAIHLKKCRCVNDSLLLFLLALNPQLKELSVSYCPITDESISVLCKLDLQYLDISGTQIGVEYLQLLTKSKIRTIGLADMPFRMRQVELLTDALAEFDSLESLDVRGTTCGLNALLNFENHNLNSLKFGTGAFLKDVSLRSLLTNFPYLKEMEFSDDVPLSDIALYHLIQKAKLLEKLVLPKQNPVSQLHLITIGTLLRIPSSLPHLRHFEAVGYHMNESIIIEFANHGKQLEFLLIGQSRKSHPIITESSIEYLVRNLTNLKRLGCDRMGLDHGLLRRIQTKYWHTLLLY